MVMTKIKSIKKFFEFEMEQGTLKTIVIAPLLLG
jgi:hypothetical protein